MSNGIDIILMEFKVRGKDKAFCGIYANDDFGNHHIYHVSDSWEGFKEEFPSVQAVMNHVADQSCFSGLSECYRMENDEVISLADDEEEGDFDDLMYSSVHVSGHESLYS